MANAQDMKKVYIDLHPLYNDPSLFKICLTDRSDGKSTQIIVLIWEEWNKERALGGYLGRIRSAVLGRRTEPQINLEYIKQELILLEDYLKAKNRAEEYDASKIAFEGSKEEGYIVYYDGEPFITCVAFGNVDKYKSKLDIKRNFAIFLDEYIPLNGRYAHKEFMQISELWKTVDRKHNVTKCLVCGNKVDSANPLFKGFKLSINQMSKKGISKFRNGTVATFVWSNKGNVERAKESAENDLFGDTEVGGYTFGEWMFDSTKFIKSNHTKNCMFSIQIDEWTKYGLFWATTGEYVFDEYSSNGVENYSLRPVFGVEMASQDIRDFLSKIFNANILYYANENIYKDMKALFPYFVRSEY